MVHTLKKPWPFWERLMVLGVVLNIFQLYNKTIYLIHNFWRRKKWNRSLHRKKHKLLAIQP